MFGKFKEGKGFYITHKGELLIWLILILIIVACSSLTFMSKEKNDENDYQIFMQDVDGLIVGSPVRMMGIQVGHVTKIKPTNSEVYVKFIITNPEVYIPQGTSVTVEFSGMAGSKSLELYPPNVDTYIDNTVPLLTTNPPKRLHDALGLLNDMFKKIGSIIYTTSSFGNKLNIEDLNINNKAKNNSDMTNFIDYANFFINNSDSKIKEMKNAIGGTKNAQQIQ